MTLDNIQQTIDELDALLDEERVALLSGNLDGLSDIHDRKSNLISHLNDLDLADQGDMVALRDKVGRNQDLLNSALEGIRAVSRRLAAVRRVRQGLETYNASGEKEMVETKAERTLEKRA